MSKKSEIFLPIDFILNSKREIVSICPSLDIILGGGLVSGTWTTFVGAEKTGKTQTMLYAAAKIQKTGRNVYYINIEGRLKPRDLLSIKNLQHDKFFIVGSEPAERNEKNEITKPASILSAEEFLTRCEKILKDDFGCCIIIDSESQLVGQGELTEDMSTLFRADGAKLFSKFVRKVSNLISVNDAFVMSVRQIMANVSGYGAATVERGSRSGAYQVDAKLAVKKIEKWLVQEKPIGQIISWDLKCGYLENSIPGSSISSYLRYGMGIDEIAEAIQLSTEFGLVELKGAWYNWQGEKFCGHDKFSTFLRENPDKQEQLLKELKDLFI